MGALDDFANHVVLPGALEMLHLDVFLNLVIDRSC
jgi:hypothetical protein